jgi:alkylhydroperoxidase family enzyme
MEDKLRALLDWCVKLTLSPGKHTESDVVLLRQAGWTDEEISAACFVASYFNFINRVADGLGVDIDTAMAEHEPLPPCPWIA